MGKVCSLFGDFFFLLFLYSFISLFFFLSFFVGKVCSLVGDFFLSFCSESTGPLDLNYSGSFFREIANKQISNFLSARLRELLISQLDHKSEFLFKNLQGCIFQKQPVSLLCHLE